jgi:hypothetical protein
MSFLWYIKDRNKAQLPRSFQISYV